MSDDLTARLRATVDRLRKLDAEASAVRRWHTWFGVHGDPRVITNKDVPAFTVIADVCTSPKDYGRANATYIAASRPALALIADCIEDVLERHRPSDDDPEIYVVSPAYCRICRHKLPCPDVLALERFTTLGSSG